MPFERYEILLPLRYNDGTPVEPEKFQQTRRELVRRFGALTMEVQSISGIWIYGGQEHHDDLIRFIVDTETSPDNDTFFTELKSTLKERFRQIDIWMTAQPLRIL